ncbi:MAG: PaaI family thioesterase [Pseudomonadota bacterium]
MSGHKLSVMSTTLVTRARQFVAALPHAEALSIRVSDVAEGAAWLAMPYDMRLVGDPETGVIHGGAVSALMDTAGGVAVITHPEGVMSTATLDLRIDYMRAAEPGQPITAHAICHHMTRSVAFVRATATEGTGDTPVAIATGTFVVERST